MEMPSPGLAGFDYVKSASLPEACRLLAERNGEALPLMGGTDLFVRIREGIVRPSLVVDVKDLSELGGIDFDQQAGLEIGAAVTLNEIAGHPAVRFHYPLLAEAARSVASYQLRNRATLGGNLCNGSPAADTAPATLVLGGRLALHEPDGEREIPAGEFFLGPKETDVRAGELLTAIRFPAPPADGAGRYLKLGRSKGGDLSIVGVAVLGFPDDAAPSGYTFRIALASVAPVPLRAPEAERVLADSPPGEKAFALAAEKAMAAARPLDDVRASAAYRKAMTRTLTKRALRQVWGELSGQEV